MYPTLTAVTPVAPGTPHAWLGQMVRTLSLNHTHVNIMFACDEDTAIMVRDVMRPGDDVVITPSTNVAEVRNLALQESESKYVAQFDADDVHLPGAVDHMVEILEGTNLSAVYGQAIDVTPQLEPLSSPPLAELVWRVADLAAFRQSTRSEDRPLGVYPMLACCGVMRRSDMGVGWDEGAAGGRYYEDNPLLLRLAARGGIGTTGRATLLYRRHDTSLTAQGAGTLPPEVEDSLRRAETEAGYNHV